MSSRSWSVTAIMSWASARPTWLPSPASCTPRTFGGCAATSSPVYVRVDGWDIRGRWFGVVVGATPQTGELPRGETILWRVIAARSTARTPRLALTR